MKRRMLLSVVGNGDVDEGDEPYALARLVGRRAIDAGFRVLTGGLGGVMEAAARGARESAVYKEGDTIGILPGSDPSRANAWIDVAITTGLDHARNVIVAHGDAMVAIGGGAGTLAEIAYAWIYKRPIIALGDEGWSAIIAEQRSVDARRSNEREALREVLRATSPAHAIELASRALA